MPGKRSEPSSRITSTPSKKKKENIYSLIDDDEYDTEEGDVEILDSLEETCSDEEDNKKKHIPPHSLIERIENYDKVLTQEVDSLPIETIDNIDVENIPIQNEFTVKSSYTRILAIDIGSSFSKGYTITKTSERYISNSIFFKSGSSEKEFIRTNLYYCLETRKTSLDKNKLKKPIPIDCIKKLLTVSEIGIIEVAPNCKLSVIELLCHFLYNLLMSITSFTRDNKTKKFSKDIDSVIFTIPTDTPHHVKQLFKCCSIRVLNALLKKSIDMNDVYIIEEFILLFHADAKDQSTSLIVDIGHLTTDSTVVVNDEKTNQRSIVYANGEVGGVSIIHKKIEQYHKDPFEVMGILFRNDDEEFLPQEYENLEKEFEEGCREITTPLLDVILQNRVSKVFIYGALTAHSFFNKVLCKQLTVENLERYIEGHEFLKDEFKTAHEFTASGKSLGRNALLIGTLNMISEAFRLNIPAFKPFIGFIEQDKYGDKQITLTATCYDMYVKQDIEIFIMKIRNTIDIDKVFSKRIPIRIDNFQKMGIMEFERFTTASVYFDPNTKSIRPRFTLHGSVDEEKVNLIFHYRKVNQYYGHTFKIPRKGRMERIPTSDIGVVFGTEIEEKTWYGSSYYINLIVTGKMENKVTKKGFLSISKHFLKEMNQTIIKKPKELSKGVKN